MTTGWPTPARPHHVRCFKRCIRELRPPANLAACHLSQSHCPHLCSSAYWRYINMISISISIRLFNKLADAIRADSNEEDDDSTGDDLSLQSQAWAECWSSAFTYFDLCLLVISNLFYICCRTRFIHKLRTNRTQWRLSLTRPTIHIGLSLYWTCTSRVLFPSQVFSVSKRWLLYAGKSRTLRRAGVGRNKQSARERRAGRSWGLK